MIERKDVGPVAVLSIAHGPVNVMDTAMLREITETFAALADDPAGAVVLAGAGRAFSAGVDLRSFLDQGEAYATEFLPALSEALMAVFTFDRPVVAAVNGHAIAGGAVLAFGADVRVMARGTGRIGTPELVVGVPFPRAPLDMVVYTVGEQVARRLVFGAQTLLPEQALELGVVDELAEPDALVDRAVEVATGLATSVPADTFAHTKAQLRRATVERIARYRVDEDPRALDIWKTRTEDGWMAGYLEQATRKS
ncbi:MAG TPA: enoyl-CoA hydratase/isomerase family protein [Pseudonocardia sp.]|jgi:enoyl-CoA hydratase